MDFGFIYDAKYGYLMPRRNYTAILHEAEVFGRERNLARFFDVNQRIKGDAHRTLRDIPGYYNYLGRHPGESDVEIEKLIARFENRKSCRAEATLKTMQQRLDLLSREPWRIGRKRLPKTSISG